MKKVTTLPLAPSLEREGEKLSKDNLGVSRKTKPSRFNN
jgi:hypothetical protein